MPAWTTLEKARAAFDAGARTGEQLAEALGLGVRQGRRWLARVDPEGSQERNPATRYSRGTYARIEALAREGVPPTWIAEDVGIEVTAVYRFYNAHGLVHGDEYRMMFRSIRSNAKLMELHRQFAPPT